MAWLARARPDSVVRRERGGLHTWLYARCRQTAARSRLRLSSPSCNSLGRARYQSASLCSASSKYETELLGAKLRGVRR